MFGGPNTYSQGIWKTRVISCSQILNLDMKPSFGEYCFTCSKHFIQIQVNVWSIYLHVGSLGGRCRFLRQPHGVFGIISKLPLDFFGEFRKTPSRTCTTDQPLPSPARIFFCEKLGGGFKYCIILFSALFGEDSQFDEHIFQMG